MSSALAPGALILKDPSSIEPFGFDWSAWLAEIEASEIITGSAWAVTGPDTALSISSDALITGNVRTLVVLTGGTAGLRYTITNRIRTTQSFEDERSFFVKVEHR